tara:strand:+ start:486 stop:806 length:321 start_codon:yes stop_codon:yes gene_type:complete
MIKKVWSTGEKYEQSLRDNRDKNIYEEIKDLDNKKEDEKEIIDMREQMETNVKDNKREETSQRMGERQMIMLGTMNPYVKSDYLRDLKNQEEYLKPKNSNFKEKSS